MQEEVHAPPGRGTDVLRCAGTEGEGPEVVAKGEALMTAMVLTRCSREEEAEDVVVVVEGGCCRGMGMLEVRSLVKSL